MRRLLLPLLLLVSACSGAPLHCPPPKGDVVYVVGQYWHTEIGIPVEELGGNLAFYRTVFPGARVILFGYGKKTFFTAPPQAISEYILGPFPGTAVVQAVGLRVTPPEAYPPEDTITLSLPQGGAKALSAYIIQDLARDTTGKPYSVARSSSPDGVFYAARSEYSLIHTCNTWVASALHAAGLPVSDIAVSFSGQVMSRAQRAAESQCRLLRGN